jgi:hypothetical protein
MAKKKDKDLLETLRGSGLREKVARAVTDSVENARHGKQPKAVKRTIESLRAAASELEDRVNGSRRRSEAAKKAARTRKREAAKRSAAARKGAKTRAKAS